MKYTGMVQDMLRTRGLSSYQPKKDTFNHNKQRPDTLKKYDLKKSYIVEDTPNFKPLMRDISNVHKSSLETVPQKYTTKPNYVTKQLQTLARHVRADSNFGYEKTKVVDNYRLKANSNHLASLTNFRSNTPPVSSILHQKQHYTKIPHLAVPNIISSQKHNDYGHQQFARKSYFCETQNIPTARDFPKQSNSIIGNIDKVQQKIRNILGTK